MMKKYSFAALKYIHDVASFECLNVGVVIFSAEQKTILCKFSRPYSRLSNTFSGFDHKHYYQLVSRIETQINNKNKEFSLEFEFGPTPKLREILNNILPVDDSSLKFFDIGGGITDDLNKTLESLFVRYVEKYTKSPKRFRREDEEVGRGAARVDRQDDRRERRRLLRRHPGLGSATR